MKNIDYELIEWAKARIQNEYPEDVALLIGMHGACKTPEDAQTMAFDYYVPATERGYQMAKTFVIEEMGYDLYPNSFERLTGIANLEEPTMIFVLDKGKVLYAKDKESEEYFAKLKEILHTNLADAQKTSQKALEYLSTTMEIFATMQFEEKFYKVRKAAGGIFSLLAHAIALTNGSYIVNGYGDISTELTGMQKKPECFPELYHKILEAKEGDSIKEFCRELIGATRDFLRENMSQSGAAKSAENGTIDYEDLAYWYQEARYSFRKIAYFSAKKEAAQCFSLGCYMQIEFDAIRDEFALKEMDMLGAFDSKNLAAFSERAKFLETYIKDTIEANGVKIQAYKNLAEFLEEGGNSSEV